MLSIKSKLTNKNLITAGFILLFLALCSFLYVMIIMPKIKSGWNYEISGNKNISTNTIVATIEFLLQKENRLDAKNIRETLEMNPRIKKAQVELILPKTLRVQIEEIDTAYIKHLDDKILEISSEHGVLQENIEHPLPAELPILSYDANDDMLRQKVRELLLLFNQTSQSHAFLWQRISEITLERNTAEKNSVVILFYPSIARCRFAIKNTVGKNELKRVWAILYYLENIASAKERLNGYHIEIQKENAVSHKLTMLTRNASHE